MKDLLQRSINPPQTEKATKEQVLNNAGGYVFKLSNLDRLRRFLILGADSGTYYVGKQKHFDDNLDMIRSIGTSAPERGKEKVPPGVSWIGLQN